MYSNRQTIYPRLKYPIMVHIKKFFWSFGFLSWLSTYVFITNCWLNRYVYKLDKLIHDSQNVCECLTLNEIHIKLASSIIWKTIDNFTNTSSTLPPEFKKIVLYIAHIILYTSTETFIYWKSKNKSLTCFQYQININVVLLSCGSFFK